jgi:hypothetical protein
VASSLSDVFGYWRPAALAAVDGDGRQSTRR